MHYLAILSTSKMQADKVSLLVLIQGGPLEFYHLLPVEKTAKKLYSPPLLRWCVSSARHPSPANKRLLDGLWEQEVVNAGALVEEL